MADMDIADAVMALHELLIEQYMTTADSHATQAECDAFIDTLKQYTSAVAVAATHAFAELVGIDPARVTMLDLTTEQWHKLEASGMLDTYISGKDTTDD